MKLFLILFILFFNISLFSYNKKAVKTTVRSAAEEVITKSGFSLLSENIQEEALKEQASQTDDGDCIDDSCLMDTGKMLAAQRLFLVKVSDLGKDNYMFKISHINLETNEQISVRSEIYSGDLSDTGKLFKFSKKFLSTVAKDRKKDRKTIPAMLELLFEVDNKNNDKDEKKYFLEIKSKYDPVNVYEGKKLLGISPLKVRLKKGFYTLVFEKKGYELAERKIRVIRNLKIGHIPFKSSIVLTVKTKSLLNGTVYVNGADSGYLENGKLDINLPQGEYKVEIKKDGYETANKKISLKESSILDFGEIYKVNGPYPIKINAKVKSKLFIDNKYIGFTPQVVRLKSGKYKIKLFNILAKNKTYNIKISKPAKFYYKMDSKFSFIDFNLETNYVFTNFPFQRNSSHFLAGFNINLFKWAWKYIDLDILGGGFFLGLNSDKMMKVHLLGINIKPSLNLKINIAIGPFLGDFINLYDNIQDSYMTYGGLKIEYNRDISEYFYIKADISAYYGTKNSEDNFYSNNDNSMENGFLFFMGIATGLIY